MTGITAYYPIDIPSVASHHHVLENISFLTHLEPSHSSLLEGGIHAAVFQGDNIAPLDVVIAEKVAETLVFVQQYSPVVTDEIIDTARSRAFLLREIRHNLDHDLHPVTALMNTINSNHEALTTLLNQVSKTIENQLYVIEDALGEISNGFEELNIVKGALEMVKRNVGEDWRSPLSHNNAVCAVYNTAHELPENDQHGISKACMFKAMNDKAARLFAFSENTRVVAKDYGIEPRRRDKLRKYYKSFDSYGA